MIEHLFLLLHSYVSQQGSLMMPLIWMFQLPCWSTPHWRQCTSTSTQPPMIRLREMRRWWWRNPILIAFSPKNDLKVTLEAMIGLIGGTMGLLTGFSILSGVEIVYFLLRFSNYLWYLLFHVFRFFSRFFRFLNLSIKIWQLSILQVFHVAQDPQIWPGGSSQREIWEPPEEERLMGSCGQGHYSFIHNLYLHWYMLKYIQIYSCFALRGQENNGKLRLAQKLEK